jgi:hypothetical protein
LTISFAKISKALKHFGVSSGLLRTTGKSKKAPTSESRRGFYICRDVTREEEKKLVRPDF